MQTKLSRKPAATPKNDDRSPQDSTLLPMLVGGLVLVIVGGMAVMAFA